MTTINLDTGFPETALQFLADLRENNTREWFEQNRDRYENDLMDTAVALVETVGTRLQSHFPHVRYDTARNGSGSLMRIYRDTRFSKDKTPYKDRIAMGFPLGEGKKMQVPSFGLQITPDDCGLIAGILGFSKDQLKQYREAVVDDTHGHALLHAIDTVTQQGDYSIGGTHYKRPPRGFEMPNDERDPYLLHNGLWVSMPAIARAQVTQPDFVDTVVSHFVAIYPVVAWLEEVLT